VFRLDALCRFCGLGEPSTSDKLAYVRLGMVREVTSDGECDSCSSIMMINGPISLKIAYRVAPRDGHISFVPSFESPGSKNRRHEVDGNSSLRG
jgi:hypothetical protein